jgi:hypothetical protein
LWRRRIEFRDAERAQRCGNALGAGGDGALGRAVTKVNVLSVW